MIGHVQRLDLDGVGPFGGEGLQRGARTSHRAQHAPTAEHEFDGHRMAQAPRGADDENGAIGNRICGIAHVRTLRGRDGDIGCRPARRHTGVPQKT